MKSSVATVYDNVLKAPALAYLDAYAGVKAAENTYQEKLEASNVALDSFEPQFREARSVVAAFLPTLTLPATLKDQPTAKEAAAKEAAAKEAAQPAPAKPTEPAAPQPVTPADPTRTPVTPADPTPNP